MVSVLETHFHNVTASGPIYGIGNMPFGANYKIYLDNCTLSGGDSGYFGYAGLIQMDTVDFLSNGRIALNLTGCSLVAKHINIASAGNTAYAALWFHAIEYGGLIQLEDVSIDSEDGAYAYGGIVAQRQDVGVFIRATDFQFSILGDVPFVRLLDGGTGSGGGTVMIDAIAGNGTYSIVDCDGPHWTGRIKNSAGNYAPHASNTNTYGLGKVIVEDTSFVSPPRWGQWYRGSSQFFPQCPPDGQFNEIRVAATGTIGSETPPTFVGFKAIQADPNASLAAYTLDHTAIAATLSGQVSSWGTLTQWGADQLVPGLFGGPRFNQPQLGTSGTFSIGGSPTGGTFTLSYGGQTTSGIAWNASAATVQSALQALSSIGTGNMFVTGGFTSGFAPYNFQFAGPLFNQVGAGLGLTINTSGLTGGTPTATVTPAGLPKTWYVGLSTSRAFRPGSYIEPAGTTGYVRASIANSSAGFTAASAGAKASAAGLSFGTATQAYTVQSLFLADAPTGGNVWAVIQLAAPLSVTIGMTPTVASGALTFTNTPLPGTGWGTLTNYGWGKLFDLAFLGSPYLMPATWYTALAMAAVTKATTSLTEPSGNGYARAAVANNTANWTTVPNGDQAEFQQYGDGINANAIAFPTPSGSWGTVVAAALTDASSAGNVWLGGTLPNPVSPTSGTAAPTFAAGSLVASVG